MRVLVTGGRGSVGRAVVDRLVEKSHMVTVVGRSEAEMEKAEYIACDVTDYDCLLPICEGKDAIVHLAAIPAPILGPDQEVFRVNCMGTFNVFEAAAQMGIDRVIPASSINALGYYFGKVQFPIAYFPIDEEHPTYTTDSYSFSKQIVEEIAAYYYRREGVESVCLRLPAVLSRDGEALERMGDMMRDYPHLARTFGRNNFWTMIDDRDAALAFELALTADIRGSHAVYVNDCMNIVGVESERLLRKHFPEVKARKHPLVGDETLLSNGKAEALIGYQPQHSWRDLVRGPDSPFKAWDVPLW